ncbi:hypothetical protein CBS101457_005416 [Exobasidium rhododendri]|nr:hypothetical protein CBS101457_005416 [Exobasidium rhododendri]
MTRLQAKQLELAMQQSTETSFESSSHPSTGDSSMATWNRETALDSDGIYQHSLDTDAVGMARWTGTTASAATTYPKDDMQEKGVEGAHSSDDRHLAGALGLAPEPSPAGFFDSSQEINADPTNRAAPSSDNRIMDTPMGKSSSSSGNADNLEVVIDTPRPSSSHHRYSASVYHERSVSPLKSVSPEKIGKKRGREVSLPASEQSVTSTNAGDFGSLGKRGQRRAAVNKTYAPSYNTDGSEFKKAKKSAKDGKSRASRASVASTASPVPVKETLEAAIVLDDDDEGEEEEADSQEARRQVKKTVTERNSKGRVRKANDAVSAEEESGSDEENVVTKGRRGAKEKASSRGKRAVVDAGSDEEEEEEAVHSSKTSKLPSRRAMKRGKGKDADGMTNLTVDRKAESTKMKGRLADEKGEASVSEEDERVDEEADADAEDEEEHDEEGEQTYVKRTGSKDKAAVLADVTGTINAESSGSGEQETTSKKGEIKPSSSSSSSASTKKVKQSKKTVAKLISGGKPLKSLLLGAQRVSGLAKRRIAPLLTIRGAPPAPKKALPIPKNKRPKEEELDSDEERARENETPEERMARFIREHEESD